MPHKIMLRNILKWNSRPKLIRPEQLDQVWPGATFFKKHVKITQFDQTKVIFQKVSVKQFSLESKKFHNKLVSDRIKILKKKITQIG